MEIFPRSTATSAGSNPDLHRSTEVIVVRHGETDYNAERRIQGHLDIELNARGRQQARALADRFRGQTVDAIYCSDLARALQTAAPLAAVAGVPVSAEPRLRERQMGAFQGHTLAEIKAQWPQVYARYRARDPEHNIPQAEHFSAFRQRVLDFFGAAAAQHAGGRIVAITHGGVLSVLFRHTLAVPYETVVKYNNPNVGVNIFLYAAGQWRLRTWGDLCHLPAAAGWEKA